MSLYWEPSDMPHQLRAWCAANVREAIRQFRRSTHLSLDVVKARAKVSAWSFDFVDDKPIVENSLSSLVDDFLFLNDSTEDPEALAAALEQEVVRLRRIVKRRANKEASK